MKKKTGTREWSQHSVNSQIGCKHDCRYCYMKPMYKRFDSHPTGIYTQEIKTEPKIRKYGGVVMYPTRHDINEENYKDCFAVIKQLLDLGNAVLVVSKMSLRVAREFCRFFKPSPNLEVRITITYTDQVIGDYFEPKAPTWENRVRALKTLYKAGFWTSVSAEPALTVPELIVEKVEPFCKGDIWVGLLNNYTFEKYSSEEAETKKHTYERIQEIYNNLKGDPKVKFKDSFLKRLK